MKIVLAAALFLAATAAHAGTGTFDVQQGRIYAAVEHYEGSGRVGCLVYTRFGTPEQVVPILVRGADGLPCSSMYRAGRKVTFSGKITQDFLEASYLAFGRRAKTKLAAGALLGTVLSVEPYTVNRDVQERGCELAIDTGDPMGAWIARFDVLLIPDLCKAAQVGQSVRVDGRLWRNYCSGDTCEDRAHVIGEEFAWQ